MTNPITSTAAEPLLVRAMRKADQSQQVRIVGGSGTTVAGLLRELDEWADVIRAEARRAALMEAVEAIRNSGPHGKVQGPFGQPFEAITPAEAAGIVARLAAATYPTGSGIEGHAQ